MGVEWLLDDEQFLEAFRNRTLPAAEFNHKGHLRLSWLTFRRYGFNEGSRSISEGIKRFAASKGALKKYHETLTQFWLRVVFHAVETKPDISEFADFLAQFPFLLNKDLPLKHWRSITLQENDCRQSWVEPDLIPLPTIRA
jgi:hypothetical protein